MKGLIQRFCSIDPRTLGLTRIAIALLLLADLAKRTQLLSTFYTNQGLLPNHRLLWRPLRAYRFSWLFSLTDKHELVCAFGLCGLVYLCLLVGYRTRLSHVLSWLCFVSLTVRVDILSNGADFVLSDLVLWTMLLPMGQRFSVDALRASLRGSPDRTIAELNAAASAARATQPVVSLAVLAALLQLSVIYFFNTIHKVGDTWKSGSAIHYLLHQERIVTALGLWAREQLPQWVFAGLSYATLVVEGALPVLILSPWGRPWTRRVAIVGIWGLHLSIAMLANVGLFSPTMMAFSLLLVAPQDWETLARVAARRAAQLQLYVDETAGVYWQLLRVLVRMAPAGRIEINPLSAAEPRQLPPSHAGLMLATPGGGVLTDPVRIWERLLAALPLGPIWRAGSIVLRPVSQATVRSVAGARVKWSGWFGMAGAHAEAAETHQIHRSASGSPFARLRGRAAVIGRELLVVALAIVATWQVLIENPAVPEWMRVRQPRVVRAAVDYTRLNQGWSMFAPDAPLDDMWIVVDAITLEGRHVDPWNELASRVADPSLRSIPKRLGQSAAFCDYTARIEHQGILHQPFEEWIMAYHKRTRRRRDRVVSFRAFVVSQNSPAPGESAPTQVRAHEFLRK